MSNVIICDKCDSRISSLGAVLTLDNYSEIEYPNQFRGPVHFCSWTCLSEWAKSMKDQYEMDKL